MNYEEFKQKLNTLDKLDFNKGVSLSDDGFTRYWILIKKEQNEYRWYATEPVTNGINNKPIARDFKGTRIAVRTQDTKEKTWKRKRKSLEEIYENLKRQNDKLIEEAGAVEETPAEEVPVEEVTTIEEDVPVDAAVEEVTPAEDETEEMAKLFDDIAEQLVQEENRLYFSVAKMHYKEKPKGKEHFFRILANMEQCDIGNPYTKEKLRDWLEQGGIIYPFVEHKGMKFFTLLVLDIDNDCPELWYKYNNGKPFNRNRVIELYSDLIGEPFLYYETYSSKEECKRFRLIYALNVVITENEYKAIYEKLANKYSVEVTIEEDGKEVALTRCIIDPSLGAKKHLVFGTNKSVELIETDIGINSLDLLDFLKNGGVAYERFSNYKEIDLGDFYPIKRVVPKDDLSKYYEMKHKYIFTDNKVDFNCFNLVSYEDLLSHLYPDIYQGGWCPNPEHFERHNGHHFPFSAGNCGTCFSDKCNKKNIHNNDLLMWYYGTKDLEVLYFVLCDMLEIDPVNDGCSTYISKNPFDPNNVKLREQGHGKEAPAGDDKEKVRMTFSDAIDYSIENKTPIYLIDGLLYEGCITQIIAPPKVGKTIFTYQMMYEAIYKKCVFSDHRVNKDISAMFLCYEGSLAYMTDKFIDTDRKIKIMNQHQRFYLDEDDNIQYLFRTAQEAGCNVIVIDPINKALAHTDRNSEKELLPVLTEIEDMALQTGIAVILVNHANRMKDAYSTEVENVSGSEATRRVSSASIVLRRCRKSAEEIEAEKEMSTEDLNKLPLKIIMVKREFRYGNQGFTQYKITADIYNGKVSAERDYDEEVFNQKGEVKARLTKEERGRQLTGVAIVGLEDGFEFNKEELSEEVSRLTFGMEGQGISFISPKTIYEDYSKTIINNLNEAGHIIALGKVGKTERWKFTK